MTVDIHSVHPDSHPVAKPVCQPTIASHQRVPPLIKAIVVVNQARHRNQPFNEELIQFDITAELTHIADDAFELFSEMFGHQNSLAPVLELPFGVVGSAFALTRLD